MTSFDAVREYWPNPIRHYKMQGVHRGVTGWSLKITDSSWRREGVQNAKKKKRGLWPALHDTPYFRKRGILFTGSILPPEISEFFGGIKKTPKIVRAHFSTMSGNIDQVETGNGWMRNFMLRQNLSHPGQHKLTRYMTPILAQYNSSPLQLLTIFCPQFGFVFSTFSSSGISGMGLYFKQYICYITTTFDDVMPRPWKKNSSFSFSRVSLLSCFWPVQKMVDMRDLSPLFFVFSPSCCEIGYSLRKTYARFFQEDGHVPYGILFSQSHSAARFKI